MKAETCVQDRRSISRDRLDLLIEGGGIGIPSEYVDHPGWMTCMIDTECLRVMHYDFRGFALSKGERFCAVANRVEPLILDGTFPRASQIKGNWLTKKRVVVLEDVKHDLYVCDGQKRTLHACFHGEGALSALLLRVDEFRELGPR